MRTIKFRAWDGKKFYFSNDDHLKWFPLRVFHEEDVCPYIFQQFTGLLDKNGKEIYEGDIVHEDNNLNDPYYSPTGVIVYQDYQFVLEVAGHATDFSEFNRDELVVIGNIYENPKLLTKIN